MRPVLKRAALAATLIGSGGFLLAGPSTGCLNFAAESAVFATDFCFVFDCQNGLFGGTIDPCSGAGNNQQTIEGADSDPIFTDCPTGP